MDERNETLKWIWYEYLLSHFQEYIYFVVENTDDDERKEKLAADTEESVTKNFYKTFY